MQRPLSDSKQKLIATDFMKKLKHHFQEKLKVLRCFYHQCRLHIVQANVDVFNRRKAEPRPKIGGKAH